MSAEPTLFRFEGFSLDLARRTLVSSDGPLALRPKSFEVLRCLMLARGRLVTKEEAFHAVWPGLAVSDESLARCISDIRAVLGDKARRLVQSVPGRGYVLAVPVEAIEQPGPLASPAPPRRPSIAVLPFADLGGERDNGCVAEGVADDIAVALGRPGGLLVVARNGLTAHRGGSAARAPVGREPGIRYLLDGSLRRAGGRLRLAVRLLEAESATQLWAEHHDCEPADHFGIPDEITARIVGRIGTELMAAEFARASRRPREALDAWECLVCALFHSSRQSQPETATALELLDRALAEDPACAQALGMKAWILVFRGFQGWEEMGDALARAKALIAEALAVDNGEVWAHLAQGMVGFAVRDNALSMAALTRAVALDPSSVNAHGLLSLAHAFGGRVAAAEAAIAQAMRLSPRDPFLSDFELYNAFIRFVSGEYREALAFAHQAHRMRPGHVYPLVLAAAAAGQLGESAVAKGFVEELWRIVPHLCAAWIEATSPFLEPQVRARLVAGLRLGGLEEPAAP